MNIRIKMCPWIDEYSVFTLEEVIRNVFDNHLELCYNDYVDNDNPLPTEDEFIAIALELIKEADTLELAKDGNIVVIRNPREIKNIPSKTIISIARESYGELFPAP